MWTTDSGLCARRCRSLARTPWTYLRSSYRASFSSTRTDLLAWELLLHRLQLQRAEVSCTRRLPATYLRKVSSRSLPSCRILMACISRPTMQAKVSIRGVALDFPLGNLLTILNLTRSASGQTEACHPVHSSRPKHHHRGHAAALAATRTHRISP